jgi:hypothetical protein
VWFDGVGTGPSGGNELEYVLKNSLRPHRLREQERSPCGVQFRPIVVGCMGGLLATEVVSVSTAPVFLLSSHPQ